VSYSSFEELLELINEADFVFGSDSLPIHLCNALQKPHYILYPNNGSTAFFTPFSMANKCYADFEKFTSLNFPI
jgi:ADP-heptose:LPS heptosyltransferase